MGAGQGGYPPFPLYITRLYMSPLVEAGCFIGRGAGVVGRECGLIVHRTLDPIYFRADVRGSN